MPSESGFLVIDRRVGESVRIGDDTTVTIIQMGDNDARLGIEAPLTTRVLRINTVDARPPRTDGDGS